MVPFSPLFPVMDFAAYWIVCPPRHLNRRIVKRFAQWVVNEAREHEERTRELLTTAGCHFQPGADLEMNEVAPWAL